MTSVVNAIRFTEVGGPEVLSVDSIDIPPLNEYDVLVRNKAIGVNFIDTYHRSGLYPVNLPSGLGKEAAGVVEAVGSSVSRVKVGDRVTYVGAPLGAYAEAHAMHENALIKLPDAISYETAAAMMLKGLTAAYLLLKTHRTTSGDTFLVHAAAGGVGSILVPCAKALGATVIGTVGRESKVERAQANGCDHVVLYREEDVAAKISEITDGRGVDVVYDSVGKDTFDMSLNSLKRLGLMVSYGNASGAVPDFSPLLLAQKGSIFLTRPTLFDYITTPEDQQELADALFARVLEGQIKISVGLSFPLEEAAKAHETLESGLTMGSMVLIP